MKSGEKKCPQCAENIKVAALVCKHCGYTFSESETALAVAKDRADRKAARGGCLILALVMCSALGWCVYSVKPDELTIVKGTRTVARERGPTVQNQHLDADFTLGEPGTPQGALDNLARIVRDTSRKLESGRIVDLDRSTIGNLRYAVPGQQKTASFQFWARLGGSIPEREEPLLSLNYDGRDLNTVAHEGNLIRVLDLSKNIALRPPVGDLYIKHACAASDADHRSSKLCKQAFEVEP